MGAGFTRITGDRGRYRRPTAAAAIFGFGAAALLDVGPDPISVNHSSSTTTGARTTRCSP